MKDGETEAWTKPLRDGGQALVLFNRGSKATRITAPFEKLNLLQGSAATIRDLWKRKDLGRFTRSFSAKVPARAVVMVKLTPS